MDLRIAFFLVLRVHLIIMAVQSGGLLGLEDLDLPKPPMPWVSEAVSIADSETGLREEALFVDISAAEHGQHAL